MIYSKANLLVVDMTKADKGIPALDNVHFCADGTTIGANGSCVMAVSPVKEDVRSKVPIQSSVGCSDTISSETVREVLRGMTRDTMFGGLLEHCDESSGKFKLTDGKRERTVAGKVWSREYVDYQRIFERMFGGVSSNRVVCNLRRLVDVLSCIDRMFPDSSKNSRVFLEFALENNIIIRAENTMRSQRVVAVLKSYSGLEAEWIDEDDWEKTLTGKNKTEKRKICKKKVVKN